MPDFKTNCFEDYFVNNESLVNYVESSEDIIECINNFSAEDNDMQIQKSFLEKYISTPDGKSSIRFENEMILLFK